MEDNIMKMLYAFSLVLFIIGILNFDTFFRITMLSYSYCFICLIQYNLKLGLAPK